MRTVRQALTADLMRLEGLRAGLGDDSCRYLFDGGDEGVLANIAGATGAMEVLRLRMTPAFRQDPASVGREEIFARWTESTADPALLLRLAKLLSAAIRQRPNLLRRPLGNDRWDWLEVFLVEALGSEFWSYPPVVSRPGMIQASLVERMVTLDGGSPAVLLAGALIEPRNRFTPGGWRAEFCALAGAADCALRHAQVLRNALAGPTAGVKEEALSLLAGAKVPIEPFAGEIAGLAEGKSRGLRQAALALIQASSAMRVWLERATEAKDAADRQVARRRLADWFGSAAFPILRAQLGTESDPVGRRALESQLTAMDGTDLTVPVDLPPVSAPEPNAPLSETVWVKFSAAFAEARRCAPKDVAIPSDEAVRVAFTELQCLVLSPIELRAPRGRGEPWPHQGLVIGHSFTDRQQRHWDVIQEFFRCAELKPIHCVRLLWQLGQLSPEQLFWNADGLLNAFRQSHPKVGLRELGAALPVIGLEAGLFARHRLRSTRWSGISFRWEPEAVWPYFAEHVDLIADCFRPSDDYFARDYRRNALELLSLFPTPPAALRSVLWEMALGPKQDRAAAQAILEKVNGIEGRLIPALEGGKADTRAAAAEWLGRMGHVPATEPLLKALAREKNEPTKVAFMLALEALGAPLEQFVSRNQLTKDAAKGLAKGIPAELAWFPFGGLPPVHWADNRRTVAADLLRWLLIQSVRLKSPEPGAMLRRYCAQFEPAEREALGQFVLTAWLAEDTSVIAPAEAEEKAKESSQSGFQWQQQFYQMMQAQAARTGQPTPVAPTLTQEQLYQQALAVFSRQPKGSAIGSKGVLAVAAACCGPAAVPVVGRYLKDWYGQRAAQCRALVQALAWMEHPTAIQLMLAVGGRFRTKSIQEEAAKQAQALAERKGWTLDELADRTVPSAGFDEASELRLDYGPRQFIARLGADFAVTLFNPDGKEISALPEPRQDDDATLASQAKKSFSTAKKELKTVLQLQRDRLYEAMCTQREWRFEDWELFLNRHPILRHYCARLVWASPQANGSQRLFRPLPDGSLTDADDEPVTLVAEDRVGLTHGSRLSPEGTAKWIAHLADYAVEPVFSQFAAMAFSLPAGREADTELADFQGHMLGAFRLRGRATKLGYVRGATQDGGWFYDYRKRFVAQGLEVVIEFTGNALPEDDRPVALRSLAFERLPAGGAGQGFRMPLGEVPAVLLCESWNDVRALAAEGTGFDPEWEKKWQS